MECQEKELDFISWTIDPLYGIEAHLTLNKLGAIAASYERCRADKKNKHDATIKRK